MSEADILYDIVFLSSGLSSMPSAHIFMLQLTYQSGTKKKHRKEMMAVKRRDRMQRRGVDLQQINLVKLFLFFCNGAYNLYSFCYNYSL